MASLVFDFGTKHIGIAIAEPRANISRSLRTVSSRKQKPNWQAIDTLVREWQPESFVVGLPLNMDGTKSDMCEAVERFGAQLNARYDKTVAFVDERLSTFEARNQARNAGIDRALSEHADAAEVIAQTWISNLGDTNPSHSTGSPR